MSSPRMAVSVPGQDGLPLSLYLIHRETYMRCFNLIACTFIAVLLTACGGLWDVINSEGGLSIQ